MCAGAAPAHLPSSGLRGGASPSRVVYHDRSSSLAGRSSAGIPAPAGPSYGAPGGRVGSSAGTGSTGSGCSPGRYERRVRWPSRSLIRSMNFSCRRLSVRSRAASSRRCRSSSSLDTGMTPPPYRAATEKFIVGPYGFDRVRPRRASLPEHSFAPREPDRESATRRQPALREAALPPATCPFYPGGVSLAVSGVGRGLWGLRERCLIGAPPTVGRGADDVIEVTHW